MLNSNDFETLYKEYLDVFPIIGEKYHPQFKQCSLSIMDNIADEEIQFNNKGICNYVDYYNRTAKRVRLGGEIGLHKWKATIAQIKKDKGSNKYDCLMGLSGGIDSTYTCLLAKRAGLNPLIIHFDNTWNSEQSIHNIEKLLNNLGFDYLTHVTDNKTFEQLQVAYFKSSVVDLDIISDHAIMVLLNKIAMEHNIKHVITGANVDTEIVLPGSWLYDWRDQKNIFSIIKHTYPNGIDLTSYPTLSFKEIKQIQKKSNLIFHDPINWLSFDLKKVEEEITNELGWQRFEGKHYESIWTRFYQCYLLPVKYHIDKRKAHLSNQIYSGLITKAEAEAMIAQPPYSKELLRADLELFLARLEMSYEEFRLIMNQPIRKHTEFEYEKNFRNQFPTLVQFLRFLKYRVQDSISYFSQAR